MNEQKDNLEQIVKTDTGAINGQKKCPKCGATEITLNVSNGKLRCEFCRHEFEGQKITGLSDDISSLDKTIYASGATNIINDDSSVMTLKCESCGAEVVIDTNEKTQSRCHWCRNVLSINNQVPNGSVPDVVLPFIVKKEEARDCIEAFVNKRKFFANPKFKEEFTTENIMGVYFPYMVVDINSHASFKGEGEHQVREYYRGSGDNAEKYYDADVYSVERNFDLAIYGLTVESSKDKLDNKSEDKTNNVINAIMPFDVENCVKYDSNYLKGFTSEKRDTNITDLQTLVDTQAKDVARFSCNKTLEFYDRGVRFSKQELDIKGSQWKSAYFPVWLYSYQQVKGKEKILHYVAVNARTKETMGSVPIHMPKLILISFLVEVLGILAMFIIDFDYNWLFLLSGFVYYMIMYQKYRNSDARHFYETETKTEMSALEKSDTLIKHEKGLRNSRIAGQNNTSLEGNIANKNLLKKLNKKSESVQKK